MRLTQNVKKLVNYCSYLSYPLMIIGLYYLYRPLLTDRSSLWSGMNYGLTYMGLAISFSTLQDTTKTQNNLSKKLYRNKKTSNIFLGYVGVLILVVLFLGIFSLYQTKSNKLNELSMGIISLGIGLIGLLKSAIEMAEHQQKLALMEATAG